MVIEEGNEDLFARKHLCIKTKHANNILDSFKIIVKGKVFQIRAKELFVWSPSFKEVPEVVHYLDDKSVKNEADINVVDNTVNNEEEESDSEAVSDTYFGDNGDVQEHDNDVDQTLNDKEEVEKSDINIKSDGRAIRDIRKEGGSILDTLDEMIK
nr:RNA-directed DNA polymerase, eukaryota [Tanacetum cinerariifolium]